ncbi:MULTISPECIES: Rne/Rng family ribonuclease [unclassified Alistipes]|jgi:ribonuclease G|uniref:Rne/Rng family ribonuclease n=1 Tax=unclassified Alistipes TaxID=2608932 RepID=UPI000B3AB54E|nr:Rne/Rng family ribonuclease [Alistipes sp. An31A]OUO22912.1 ribonuclease E/G [Alistipes sp. An31A]HIV33045.1 Rne/Rng family ribonuclease [Candidatus Alistipes excrementigallinarum]
MNKELIVNVNPTEISIALCEDKVLVELNKEQCQTGFAVGDIYLGRVRKIMPGLNAAFVNIGHEKDAFIHYLDLGTQFPSLQKMVESQQPGKRGLRTETMKLEPALDKNGKISSYLQVGQSIMVQVAKEAISTKGPRLTSDISLAGRNVVLVPFSSKVFLSQKIRSADEKKRLKRIAAAVLPKNFGVIIRTAAMEAKDEDIEHDIQTQIDRWRKTVAAIRKNAESVPAQLMSEMSRANTIIRDSLNDSFSQIAVDDEAMYNEIRNYIKLIDPSMVKIVKLYKGNVPIFDNFDISKQIKSLFAKYVSLRRGAYLIIEHTEAMNVIDVNSGNRTKAEDNQEQTAMDVNLAAAKEIARQLRLRDLGGIVIIDFIDLHKAQNRQALYDEMVKLMATDKAKHTVLPLTKFGLMQITRQRVRPVAVESVSDVCPTCNGTGKIEPTVLLDKKIENQISFLTLDRGHKYIKLVVSPYVASYLRKGLWSLRRRWEWKYKARIRVVEDQSIGIIEVHYHDRKDNDLININK